MFVSGRVYCWRPKTPKKNLKNEQTKSGKKHGRFQTIWICTLRICLVCPIGFRDYPDPFLFFFDGSQAPKKSYFHRDKEGPWPWDLMLMLDYLLVECYGINIGKYINGGNSWFPEKRWESVAYNPRRLHWVIIYHIPPINLLREPETAIQYIITSHT